MNTKIANKETIEKLNDDAEKLVAQGWSVYDALVQAAHDNGFWLIFENGDAEIWGNEAGDLVNVWVGSGRLGFGYDGFDDWIEWYTEIPENR